MAYSELPNKVEVYTREGVKYFFVINYYDDTPNLVNWYYVANHGIDNEGTDSILHINEEIERYGWKLYKTLYNKWFEFEEVSSV